MRIPRDIDGKHLTKLLSRYGYVVTRQSGSHIRLTSSASGGQHHVTIPYHNPLRVGTLNSILDDISKYLNMSKDDLKKELFKL